MEVAYRAIEDGLKIYSSKNHELFLLIGCDSCFFYGLTSHILLLILPIFYGLWLLLFGFT